MYNDVIFLLSEKKSIDEFGDSVTEITERMVFAEVDSVRQSEFYQASALKLKLERVFKIADWMDYGGQSRLKYKALNETEYSIYEVVRTYRVGNELEIVVKRGDSDVSS